MKAVLDVSGGAIAWDYWLTNDRAAVIKLVFDPSQTAECPVTVL